MDYWILRFQKLVDFAIMEFLNVLNTKCNFHSESKRYSCSCSMKTYCFSKTCSQKTVRMCLLYYLTWRVQLVRVLLGDESGGTSKHTFLYKNSVKQAFSASISMAGKFWHNFDCFQTLTYQLQQPPNFLLESFDLITSNWHFFFIGRIK